MKTGVFPFCTQQDKKKRNGCIKESTQKKENRLFELLKTKKQNRKHFFSINDDVHVILNDVEMKIYGDNHFHLDDDDDFDGI